MKQLLAISIVLLAFASCNKNKTKKEPLVGNVAFLVGEWDWEWTKESHQLCDPSSSQIDTVLATASADSYQLHFKEEGIIEYYKNTELIEERHVCLGDVDEINGAIFMDIFPDENIDLRHGCVWDGNRLIFGRFPFESDELSCPSRLNYFKKQ